MWLVYQTCMTALLLLSAPFLLLRKGRHYLQTLPGRLGMEPAGARPGALWLHAVSVGEVGVAKTLAEGLIDVPLLVTTTTPTGQASARRAFPEPDTVRYVPFDLGLPLRSFLDRHRPHALVLIEGELWPLMLRRVGDRGLPIVMINGRISDHSFARMRRLRRWLGPLFSQVDSFGVQSEQDRARLLALGVDRGRIVVTGNLKYETDIPKPLVELEAALGRIAGTRSILIAGSTMPTEEEQVLEAFSLAGGGEGALLLLAPRHPERFDGVAKLLDQRGLAWTRRSTLERNEQSAVDVLLLDTLGELAALYRIAAGAFIGGTLVSTGGHNPLEAARYGIEIAVGPSMENFREMAEHFDRADAWRRVEDVRALAGVFGKWIAGPAAAESTGKRARSLVESNRGALSRTLELLQPVLATMAPNRLQAGETSDQRARTGG